jgi:DinB family protein
MPPHTPYAKDLGDAEPLETMQTTLERIRALTKQWSPNDFERSYAPEKWTARKILIHLAQTELALGTRVRMALATPGYMAQAFDQDAWMILESGGAGAASGPVAVEALIAANAFNRVLFGSLTPAQRATPFSHPEYGALTVDWVIHQMAGHLVHHLKQLEQIRENVRM